MFLSLKRLQITNYFIIRKEVVLLSKIGTIDGNFFINNLVLFVLEIIFQVLVI